MALPEAFTKEIVRFVPVMMRNQKLLRSASNLLQLSIENPLNKKEFFPQVPENCPSGTLLVIEYLTVDDNEKKVNPITYCYELFRENQQIIGYPVNTSPEVADLIDREITGERLSNHGLPNLKPLKIGDNMKTKKNDPTHFKAITQKSENDSNIFTVAILIP